MKTFKMILAESADTREFRTDVPSERWLENKISDAKSGGRNEHGVPTFNSTTAYEKGNRPLHLPVSLLAKVKGQRGEQKNVRPDSLNYLESHMKETKKLPANDEGKEYAPFIQVGHDGEPWVNEGNHRIMAAKKLGWKSMPVEVRYHDGGERHAHKYGFAPEQLLAHHEKHKSDIDHGVS